MPTTQCAHNWKLIEYQYDLRGKPTHAVVQCRRCLTKTTTERPDVAAEWKAQAPRRERRQTAVGALIWIAVALTFGGCLYAMDANDDNQRPPPAVVNAPVGGGYENPAPGDDGSYDCPPGGGPVVVPPGDPAGLDADGDGIGCEG